MTTFATVPIREQIVKLGVRVTVRIVARFCNLHSLFVQKLNISKGWTCISI